MSLNHKFWVYLHFTLLFTPWSTWSDHSVNMNFASEVIRSKHKTRYKLNEVLISEVLFMST